MGSEFAMPNAAVVVHTVSREQAVAALEAAREAVIARARSAR
jgi:hypothetical protein